MKIQSVKDGYDFLSKYQRIRNYINAALKEVFEEYGFNPIEPSILCYCDILSDKYDKNIDILKEIYRLKDQGNREKIPFVIFFNIKDMFNGKKLKLCLIN